MSRKRKLTPAAEDEILDAVNVRKRVTQKALMTKYNISSRTLRLAVDRARRRRELSN